MSKSVKSHREAQIARNTLFNLLGYGIPILLAIFLIPILISSLGKERFGVLTLVWAIIGYSSFFDFGISRSLTKVVAEKIAISKSEEIPVIFWSALVIILVGSIIVCVILASFLPSIFNKFLNISDKLKPETLKVFSIVILAIPIITSTAALKGVLEAHQKFKIINYIRVFLGIATFGGPPLVLIFVDSLFWVVVYLIITRIIIWLMYFSVNIQVQASIRREIHFNFNKIRPLIQFGLWISLANMIGPLILYSDKFFIGMLVSAEAITYYATPYEMITKILILPTSLVTVLFPVFSANFENNPEHSRRLFFRATKFNFLIIYPVVLITITFSKEIMHLWLGQEFSDMSFRVLQLLAAGILMNSLSLIPNTFLQSAGKPHIPTLSNLFLLPLYLFSMWLTIRKWGITGASLTYMAMATLDSFIMYFMVMRTFSIRATKKNWIVVLILIIPLILSFYLEYLLGKIFFNVIFITSFYFFIWTFYLSQEEKHLLFAGILDFNKY